MKSDRIRQAFSGSNVVVTGGAGFIGSWLVQYLSDIEANVLIVDNLISGHPDLLPSLKTIQFEKLDITNQKILEDILKDFKPHYIFHLAALHFIPYCNAHPMDTINVNVLGTQSLLHSASDIGSLKGLIFASSAAVYGISDLPHREDSPLTPIDVYGLSKKMGEQLVRFWAEKTRIPIRVARLFNVYGPHETNPHLIPEIVLQAKKGNRTELGNLDTKRDYIFVKDVIEALLILGGLIEDSNNLVDIFNVGTGREYSAREVVDILSSVTNISFEVISVPHRRRSVDRTHLTADITKLRHLGWCPRFGMEEGLQAIWEYPMLVAPSYGQLKQRTASDHA